MRTSEDKVRRKDLWGFVRAVYVLKKLPDVSGPGLVEAGCYTASSAQVWQVERGLSTVQVELNWSYRPHGHVDMEAYEECPGSPHLSYH